MTKLKSNRNLPVEENMALVVWGNKVFNEPVIFFELLLAGFPLLDRKELKHGEYECNSGAHRADTCARR
jgi:hypothetical protein